MNKWQIDSRKVFAIAALLVAAGLYAAVQFSLPFGPWKRLSAQPIISP